jgi:hypothetical protein
MIDLGVAQLVDLVVVLAYVFAEVIYLRHVPQY